MARNFDSGGSGAMQMSRRDVEDLYSSMRDARQYIEAQRDPQRSRPSMTDRLVRSAEVGAGAAGVGLLAGRLGTTQIGNTGIPMGLALSAAGHAVAVFGLAGRFDEHVSNLADGALAGWLTMWGAGQGRGMRERAGMPVGPITAGHDSMGAVGCPPEYYRQPAQMMPANARPGEWMLGINGGQERPLTEAELQIMAANSR